MKLEWNGLSDMEEGCWDAGTEGEVLMEIEREELVGGVVWELELVMVVGLD
jgi:hypothetical protein